MAGHDHEPPDQVGATQFSRRRLLALGVAVPLVGRTIGVARGLSAGVRPEALALPGGASAYVALAPKRLADTRPEYGRFGFEYLDENTIRVKVAGREGVPVNASAAVLNVTMTNPSGAGFVNVYPTGVPRRENSAINVERPGQILANMVTVQLGTDGCVDLFCFRPADLVVDVSGAYVPVAGPVGAGRFIGLNAAIRVLDTRDLGAKAAAGGVTRVNLSAAGVPASASAVVVNVTIDDSNGPGFWTAFPAGGALPNSSTVNTDDARQIRANQAIVPLVGLAAFDVYSMSGGHLIVDVAGYFTGATFGAGTDGLFVPNAPARVIDTRYLPQYGRMYAGWVCEFDFAGRSASQAVVINLTTTETRGPGYFTAYPARTNRPIPASNLNATYADQTIANHAIVRTSNASGVGVAVYTYGGGHVIVDVAGYFIGTPTAAYAAAPVNVVPPPPPPPPPSPLPYWLEVPKLGLGSWVYEGVGNNIVDRGVIGHWPGTGFAGEVSHMILFAHRTEHGGVFRNLHLLGPGDQVVINGTDGRQFVYTYSRRDLTGPSGDDIFNVGLDSPLPSISLVACSKLNYLPTDVRYRLVVTFSLISST